MKKEDKSHLSNGGAEKSSSTIASGLNEAPKPLLNSKIESQAKPHDNGINDPVKVKTAGAPSGNSRKKSVSEHIQDNIKVKENTKMETRAVTASKRKHDYITNGSDQPTHQILQKPKRI